MTISEKRRVPGRIGNPVNHDTEQPMPAREISIVEELAQFMDSERFKGFSQSTRAIYSKALGSVQEYCKEKEIADLTQFSDERRDQLMQEMKRKGIGDGLTRSVRQALATFRIWKDIQELTQIDPSKSRVLSSEEITHLIKKTRDLRDTTLILIALRTGATLSEILRLTKEEINLNDKENPSIFFNETRETSFRYVPIDKRVADVISLYIEKHILGRDGALFPSSGRKKLSQLQAGLILLRYGKGIGIPNLDFSMLRNTFIYNFNGSEKELKQILGVSE